MTQPILPYTAVDLTGTINVFPNLYGLLNDLDVFPDSGSTSTLIEVRKDLHTLSVLPVAERGNIPTAARRPRGSAIYLEIPHFPMMDFISPQDLQNMITVAGNQARPKTLEDEMARRLMAIANRHNITLEWVRMGALKGLITDGNGQVIYDLFQSFDLTKKTVYFDLASSTADVDGACSKVIESISTNLRGEVMTHVEVICSSAFFSHFVAHPKVQKYYLNWQAANKLSDPERQSIGGQMGRVFDYGNIRWREYMGMAPINGVSTSFVDAGFAHAWPVGTMDSFKTHHAPPHDIRYVNQPGQRIFVSPEPIEHGQGIELLSQSNPLAICRRPEVLVELNEGLQPT